MVKVQNMIYCWPCQFSQWNVNLLRNMNIILAPLLAQRHSQLSPEDQSLKNLSSHIMQHLLQNRIWEEYYILTNEGTVMMRFSKLHG